MRSSSVYAPTTTPVLSTFFKSTDLVFRKILIIEILTAVLSFVSVLLALVENSIAYNTSISTAVVNTVLRSIGVALTFALVALIFWKHFNRSQTDRFCMHLIFKLLVYILVCPPYADFTFSYYQSNHLITYSFNDLCAAVCLFRLSAIFPLLKRVYGVMHPTSSSLRRIVRLPATASETRFALISCMKRFPYIVLPGALGLAVIVFASMVQIAERPLNPRFTFYGNSLWFVIVTMATRIVGYGDMYPVTHAGRIIVCIAIIYGVCIISLYVVAFTEFLSLDSNEQKVYEEIKAMTRNDLQPRILMKALLRLLVWKRRLKSKNSSDKANLFESRRKMLEALNKCTRDPLSRLNTEFIGKRLNERMDKTMQRRGKDLYMTAGVEVKKALEAVSKFVTIE